ncbi:AraC family transcriptional regulator [Bacillaceae bacterium SIJ1]|uniref:AraC family transcriptional regulator n=1 Tax=Litoribacterium kuwaitense TaxID=1398745 RepID=UPI0013EBE475|nr:AraC family transcriptional regulator [Litoribacterium kuwaitense]NGP45549.1 AraC family transcriptional regulator [Litoribacterium kuwaitense]
MNKEFFYITHTHSASETAKKLWFFTYSVGWFACKPNYVTKRDPLFGFQLKYVIKGKGKVVWHEKTFTVSEGDIFYLDLNQHHHYYADPDDPFEVLWIHFGGRQAEDYFQLLNGNNSPVFRTHDPDNMHSLFFQLYDLIEKRHVGHEAKASAVITNILTDMIVSRMKGDSHELSLKTPSYPDPIQHAIYYIEHHFAEPLKLEDIAKEMMLSPFYFSRLFKRTTGYTVIEYLQKFRINQAKYLLTKTNKTIGEIAEKTGFTEQSYFGKLFKRYEQQTPMEYRLSNSVTTPQNTHTDQGNLSQFDSQRLNSPD